MHLVRVQEHGTRFVGAFMLLFVELCSEIHLSLQHYRKNDISSQFKMLSVSVLYRSIIKEDMHQK